MTVQKATNRRWFTARANGLFGRFRKDRSGVTAIEFGIVAVPFFALLLGTVEVALIFFATQLMDSAMTEAARMIRTGQAQSQSFSEGQFKKQVCAEVVILSDCENNIKLDVRTYQDFEATSANLGNPIDEDGNLAGNFGYQPGTGGDIVLVRAFYEWKTIVPNMGFGAGNLANGNRLIASTAAFRNEPF